jgi:hypothetical protein
MLGLLAEAEEEADRARQRAGDDVAVLEALKALSYGLPRAVPK